MADFVANSSDLAPLKWGYNAFFEGKKADFSAGL